MSVPAERRRGADATRVSRHLSLVAAATGVTCEDVVDVLPGITDGSTTASGPMRAHLEACLHCQAELAHYHRVLRVLPRHGPRRRRTRARHARGPPRQHRSRRPVPGGALDPVGATSRLSGRRRPGHRGQRGGGRGLGDAAPPGAVLLKIGLLTRRRATSRQPESREPVLLFGEVGNPDPDEGQ